MKHKRFSRTTIILSSVLLITVICGTIVLGAASGANGNAIPEYSVNADGLTYGSAQYACSVESLPDLISAGSIDGIDFYIYS